MVGIEEMSESMPNTNHARWQPYPAYKDSGVEWVGEVPVHWEVRKIKFLLDEPVTDGPHETAEFISEGIPFLSVDSIQEGELIFENCRYISNENHQRYRQKVLPRIGDILLGKAASTGKIAQVKVDFEFSIWSPLALIRLDQSQVSPTFIEYVLKSLPLQAQIDIYCNANTQKNISMQDIPILQSTLPPLPEQRAIATFLDRETAKIDALIAKKQRLIELLQEKRTALISQAVTKGLDRNVPMKDSGVEWIGQMPEHWELWKIAHAFQTIGSGTTPPSGEREWYDNGEIPWVQTSELRENIIYETEKLVTWDAIRKYSALKIYPVGSLVIAMYGATIGRLGILGLDSSTNQACCVLASPTTLDIKFTFYWLYGFRNVIVAFSFGGGQPNISQGEVRSIRIPTPDIAGQRAIATFLDRETAKIDALVAKVQAAIQTLQEYRTALISAAVTGKIDVREPSPQPSPLQGEGKETGREMGEGLSEPSPLRGEGRERGENPG